MRSLLSGNEAIARGAYEAGVNFATGYPGTPSTEILENLVKYRGPQCQWSVNEKVALEVAAGASWVNARVLVAMKHVGLNVAADPLFTLAYTGVRGGLVVVTADDPQQFSSQNEQDSRHYARAAKIPMLEPADSDEARLFTRIAFGLSETFDIPFFLRSSTRISHSKSMVRVAEPEQARSDMRLEKEPEKLVMVPEFGRRRHVDLERRMADLEEYAEGTDLNRERRGAKGQPGIIAAGVAYQYAREVFPRAGFLKLGMVHPLPRKRIAEFARRYGRVIVVEELDPFIEGQVRGLGLKVEGSEKRSLVGELTPELVRQAWGKKQRKRFFAVPDSLPPRPPVMCPGCPHRGIFTVLKAKGAFVTGDIGCYTLAAIPPLGALHTCLCMGASIGTAAGMEKVLPPEAGKKVVAVIGDSTFFHSGLTPLADTVYNGGKTLTVVLDNRTTAMTGRQEHPGSGRRLDGEASSRMDIAAIARAMGVRKVERVKAYDYRAIERKLTRLLKAEGPAVLVNEGDCVLLHRTPLAPSYAVASQMCNGCRRCLLISCPSLSLDRSKGKRGVAVIDGDTCFGCALCADVCPKGAITGTARSRGARRKSR